MLCSQKKDYMFFVLIFLVIYVAFTVWMTIVTLLYVLPAVLYGTKAFCNLQLVVSGYWLYKGVLKEGESLLPAFAPDALKQMI